MATCRLIFSINKVAALYKSGIKIGRTKRLVG
jgi:hypothetical protein